jgi:hypothetical protein
MEAWVLKRVQDDCGDSDFVLPASVKKSINPSPKATKYPPPSIKEKRGLIERVDQQESYEPP